MNQHVQNKKLTLTQLNQIKKKTHYKESYKIKDIVKKIGICLI